MTFVALTAIIVTMMLASTLVRKARNVSSMVNSADNLPEKNIDSSDTTTEMPMVPMAMQYRINVAV